MWVIRLLQTCILMRLRQKQSCSNVQKQNKKKSIVDVISMVGAREFSQQATQAWMRLTLKVGALTKLGYKDKLCRL